MGGDGGESADITPDGPDAGGQIGIILQGDFIAETPGLNFRVFSEPGVNDSGRFMDQRAGKQFFLLQFIVGGQMGDVVHGTGPFG
jgi:hypothetical protein